MSYGINIVKAVKQYVNNIIVIENGSKNNTHFK